MDKRRLLANVPYMPLSQAEIALLPWQQLGSNNSLYSHCGSNRTRQNHTRKMTVYCVIKTIVHHMPGPMWSRRAARGTATSQNALLWEEEMVSRSILSIRLISFNQSSHLKAQSLASTIPGPTPWGWGRMGRFPTSDGTADGGGKHRTPGQNKTWRQTHDRPTQTTGTAGTRTQAKIWIVSIKSCASDQV